MQPSRPVSSSGFHVGGPLLGGFSLGSTAADAAISAAIAAATRTTTTEPKFSFGSAPSATGSTWGTTSTPTQQPQFSFGGGPSFSFGGNPTAPVAAATTALPTAAANELQESDFDTLSQLLAPTLPKGHPALLFLAETPRRNFTSKLRQQSATELLNYLGPDEKLFKFRAFFELIRPLFKGDVEQSEGMKLQLEQTFNSFQFGTGPFGVGAGNDIRNTWLGAILSCLQQYPWFSKKVTKIKPTPSAGVSFGAAAHRFSPLWSDVGEEMIGLGQIVLGLKHNLSKYGFPVPKPMAIGGSGISQLLSACILQYHRQPLSTLIQPMCQIVQFLLQSSKAEIASTSASAISLTASAADSLVSLSVRSDVQLAFDQLFQQNPDMTKELLPFVRLLRQAGAQPTAISKQIKLSELDSNTTTTPTAVKDEMDDRQLNMWVYFSQWLTLDKVEFLLRWLLEEPNLGDLYDTNYRLDWGDGRGSQTILSYVTRLKAAHPTHTALQIYHQILVHLTTVLTGHNSSTTQPSFESDEEMAANLAALSTSAWTESKTSSATASSSSVVSGQLSRDGVKTSACPSSLVPSSIRVVDQSSFRSWLEDALVHVSPASCGCGSARLLERLTAPFLLTSNNSRFYVGKSTTPELTPIQKASLYEAVSALLVVLREHPEELNLFEEDAFGNTLFHTILALPTYELIRLKSVEKEFLRKIDSLPPRIMSDFRRVLESQSNPIVNELFTETLLFNNSIPPTLSTHSRLLVGHRIYPIFHPDTIRLEVTGIQFYHPVNTLRAPRLQLWDCQSQTVLGTVDTSHLVLTHDDYNVAEFDEPIILTEAQATTGVMATKYFHETNNPFAYLQIGHGASCVNPHEDYRLDGNSYYSCGTDGGYPNQTQGQYYYLVAPVTRKIYSSNLACAPNSAKAATSSLKDANSGDFLTLYSNQNRRFTSQELVDPIGEIGSLIEFHSNGYVHGLRIDLPMTGFKSQLQTTLKLWNSETRELLASTPIIISHSSLSNEWPTSMFQQPIPVSKGIRCIISFDATNSFGAYYTAPPSITRNEFKFISGVSSPTPNTCPITPLGSNWSNIDLLFSQSPMVKAATTKSTSTPSPPPAFSFSTNSGFTIGTTNPAGGKEESKENSERELTTATSDASSSSTPFPFVPMDFGSVQSPKREYSKLTPESLHGNALPTYQVNGQGQIIRVIGNSTSAPLDLLFTRHSPYPAGEFIYQLFDRLLTKAIPYHLPELELSSLIESGSVGNLLHVMTQFSKMEMNELRVWLDLFDRHSIHSTKSNKQPQTDIFEPWIKAGDLGRIREWFMENHSTDALWPTRQGSQQNESLLDTAKRLSEDATFIAQGQNGTQIKMIIKYLETQRDRWYELYLPLIRVNVTELLIPDLTEIVCGYLLPSRHSHGLVQSSPSDPSAAASSTNIQASNWTTAELAAFLRSVKLDHIIPVFNWNKVDAKQFLELKLTDIRDRLGIRDPNDVTKVLNCIGLLRGAGQPQTQSTFGVSGFGLPPTTTSFGAAAAQPTTGASHWGLGQQPQLTQTTGFGFGQHGATSAAFGQPHLQPDSDSDRSDSDSHNSDSE